MKFIEKSKKIVKENYKPVLIGVVTTVVVGKLIAKKPTVELPLVTDLFLHADGQKIDVTFGDGHIEYFGNPKPCMSPEQHM